MDPSNVQSPRLGRRSTLVDENYERVTHSPSGRAIPLRVQIDSVLTKIAELTSLNSHQPAEDFKQFETLKLKLEQLENLQRDQRFPSRPPPSTEQANKLDFEEFDNWLIQNGVNLGPYKLSYSNLEGKGLTATEYIKQDTLLFNIPKKLMLTTTTASECPITSELISKDPMLKAIPSLRLVIHLLVERFKEHKSFWNAYINLLPKVNYTPLEFNLEELLYLKGSLTMVEIIKLTKRAAKQYLHFYSILENYGESTFILTKRNFTWAAFKWALITVMSRQNPLPFAPNGESPHTGLGLVPLWDLCNHEHGQITTFYNPETESLESAAMQTFQAGDPIRMHYGNRPNIDFFLYSGFCQPKITEFDRLPISLAILDQNDPLSYKRKKLCQLLRLPTSNTFQLLGAPILENSKPLMRFLVIQVLPEADIESLLEQTPDLAPNLAASLGREGLKDRNQAEILLDNKLQDTKCLKHVIQWLLIKLKVQFRFLSGTIKNDEYILNSLSPSLPSSFPTIFILKMKFIEYAQLELIMGELESLIKDLMLNQSKSFSSANSSLLI